MHPSLNTHTYIILPDIDILIQNPCIVISPFPHRYCTATPLLYPATPLFTACSFIETVSIIIIDHSCKFSAVYGSRQLVSIFADCVMTILLLSVDLIIWLHNSTKVLSIGFLFVSFYMLVIQQNEVSPAMHIPWTSSYSLAFRLDSLHNSILPPEVILCSLPDFGMKVLAENLKLGVPRSDVYNHMQGLKILGNIFGNFIITQTYSIAFGRDEIWAKPESRARSPNLKRSAK